MARARISRRLHSEFLDNRTIFSATRHTVCPLRLPQDVFERGAPSIGEQATFTRQSRHRLSNQPWCEALRRLGAPASWHGSIRTPDEAAIPGDTGPYIYDTRAPHSACRVSPQLLRPHPFVSHEHANSETRDICDSPSCSCLGRIAGTLLFARADPVLKRHRRPATNVATLAYRRHKTIRCLPNGMRLSHVVGRQRYRIGPRRAPTYSI